MNMITERYTEEEIKNELDSELMTISYVNILMRFSKDFGKKVLKQNKFPFCLVYNWTTPNKNKLSLIFTANNRGDYANPIVNNYISWNTTEGIKVAETTIVNSLICEMKRECRIFNAHFFKRYRERFLKDEEMPISLVVAKYIARNHTYFYKKMTPDFMKHSNVRESNIVMVTEDGFALADMKENGIILCNTFLSDEQMKYNQREVLLDRHKYVEGLHVNRQGRFVKVKNGLYV